MCARRLSIKFLTPCENAQFRYADDVERACKAFLSDGPSLTNTRELPQPDHNLASGSFLIEYGKTRALFMADAVAPLWEERLQSSESTSWNKPVHFIKVSHHGSENGYLRDLYELIGDPENTIAVVTPFNKGNVQLPMSNGIQSLRQHVKDLYCTNGHSAEESTGLKWDIVNPPDLPNLPAKWVEQIRNNAGLTSLLVPGVVHGTSESSASLPTKWIEDAHASPKLWQLIRPEFRRSTSSALLVPAHTLSAFYDENGNLLKTEAGESVAKLAD